MKKYNSIAITLIVVGMLGHSCGPALAESSEPFPDGGYVTARGFQLVKFGGEKPEIILAVTALLLAITIRLNRR